MTGVGRFLAAFVLWATAVSATLAADATLLAAKEQNPWWVLDGSPPAPEGELYLIDAHNQSDQHVGYDEILALLEKAEVRRVILTQRGRARIEDLVDLAASRPDRITAAVRTWTADYIKGNVGSYARYLDGLVATGRFGAMGEVILWHAAKGDKARQWVIDPESRQVHAALAVAKANHWPFIAHIEFASAGGQRAVFMAKLETLLRDNRDHPFALIHMGQLPADEVARLIVDHPNVFFITSSSDPVVTRRSTQPWINMFAGDRLAPTWKALVIRYPERFIFGIDSVWKSGWRKRYVKRVRLWRKALNDLPPEVAHLLAHGNAERLWRLPPGA